MHAWLLQAAHADGLLFMHALWPQAAHAGGHLFTRKHLGSEKLAVECHKRLVFLCHRRRMMMGNGPPASTLGALAYIARHEGVGALYNGIWLTWVRSAVACALELRWCISACPAA